MKCSISLREMVSAAARRCACFFLFYKELPSVISIIKLAVISTDPNVHTLDINQWERYIHSNHLSLNFSGNVNPIYNQVHQAFYSSFDQIFCK